MTASMSGWVSGSTGWEVIVQTENGVGVFPDTDSGFVFVGGHRRILRIELGERVFGEPLTFRCVDQWVEQSEDENAQ